MSNKITALVINNKYGILEAQSMEFTTDPNKLTQIKGIVGAGKSSVPAAIAVGLSGGSTRELSQDMKIYDNVDIETHITGDIYMNTIYKDGASTSTVYLKGADGKKIKNPTINGKKFTPAALRDYLKTDLTFSSADFISQNPRTQNDWMMKVYKEKLADKGVIFDTSSAKYKGSILYRLSEAKAERDRKYNKVTELNAYAKRLEEEGHSENNIPEAIDIEAIEKRHKDATEAYYKKLSDIDTKIADIKLEVSKTNSVIENYNESLETKKELADAKEQKRVDDANKQIAEQVKEREKVKEAVEFLEKHGFTGLQSQFKNLPLIEAQAIFTPSEIVKVPKDENGKFINSGTFSQEVTTAFITLDLLRGKARPLFRAKKEIVEPGDEYKIEIEKAKASNRIAIRWSTFYEHQEADIKVKEIWAEYKKIFTEIDLGVDGLKMMVIGESEIRTVYNGAHDPELFHNKKKEYRAVSSYSETQRNILAILMQIHLLEEKKKQGIDGLRYLCIDTPLDNKTRDMLIGIQKKYDIQLLTTSTGDFDRDKLNDSEILIENGYLLRKESEE